VFNFLVSERINYPISIPGPTTRLRPLTRSDIGVPAGGALAGFGIMLALTLWFLGPLTYGTPGLTGEQVSARRLFTSWTLHFAVCPTVVVDLTRELTLVCRQKRHTRLRKLAVLCPYFVHGICLLWNTETLKQTSARVGREIVCMIVARV